MTRKTIGAFELEISDPHPCWITISKDETRLSLRHEDLRDLEFLVATAIRKANDVLGPRESVDGRSHARS